jgi:ribosomal protein L37AE/L43A
MKIESNHEGICPICGQIYHGRPALSRTDNETLICADCGVRQALTALEISAEEQEKILSIMHRSNPQE